MVTLSDVLRIKVWTMQSEVEGIKRVWYILEHEFFTEKVKTAPYPPSMTKVRSKQRAKQLKCSCLSHLTYNGIVYHI